jgi:putative alpha-1,2-mannosidase
MVAMFDRPPVAWGTWTDSSRHLHSTRAEGDHSGAWVRFAAVRDRPLTLRVGTSFVSAAQAEVNLRREVEGKSFDEIRMKGRRHWNQLLQLARVEGGPTERRKVFYTA